MLVAKMVRQFHSINHQDLHAPMAASETPVLKTVANPGPLGLAGFGLTTIVLSSINACYLMKPCPS
jgi:succinate-acetate transporter protein